MQLHPFLVVNNLFFIQQLAFTEFSGVHFIYFIKLLCSSPDKGYIFILPSLFIYYSLIISDAVICFMQIALEKYKCAFIFTFRHIEFD